MGDCSLVTFNGCTIDGIIEAVQEPSAGGYFTLNCLKKIFGPIATRFQDFCNIEPRAARIVRVAAVFRIEHKNSVEKVAIFAK